eukprot:TRINITY_DN11218_c0_g1_i1.p1 TRINITY_DN11218_c0_g1~~TRINITY_DN11218_c0_g1_i1.p1  ORF type:complete len:117 (+),score=6.06 TRINITY_DN11218_c0_g1_i1:124-474(+)
MTIKTGLKGAGHCFQLEKVTPQTSSQASCDCRLGTSMLALCTNISKHAHSSMYRSLFVTTINRKVKTNKLLVTPEVCSTVVLYDILFKLGIVANLRRLLHAHYTAPLCQHPRNLFY